MGEIMIQVKDLVKNYGKIKAVKGISFYAEKGKLFAFLGPNGAGKSTTIDIICTFLRGYSGQVKIGGHLLGEDDPQIRRMIGAVFQDGLLDDRLTVKENMKTRGRLYGLKGRKLKEAVMKAVLDTESEDLLDRPYGKLSGGQKRRADIARALVNRPQVLFMDEPTTGLDPQTRKTIWSTIEKLQKESQMTIFLTTHYMEEAAAADYVVIIDNGLIAAKGTPRELKDKYAKDVLKINSDEPGTVAKIAAESGYDYEIKGDEITIKLDDTLEALKLLRVCKNELNGFEVVRGTMDDAFINITGREMRE